MSDSSFISFSRRWVNGVKAHWLEKSGGTGVMFGSRLDPDRIHPFEISAQKLADACDRLKAAGLPGPILPPELTTDLTYYVQVNPYHPAAPGAGEERAALIEPTKKFTDLLAAVLALDGKKDVFDKVFVVHGGPRVE